MHGTLGSLAWGVGLQFLYSDLKGRFQGLAQAVTRPTDQPFTSEDGCTLSFVSWVITSVSLRHNTNNTCNVKWPRCLVSKNQGFESERVGTVTRKPRQTTGKRSSLRGTGHAQCPLRLAHGQTNHGSLNRGSVRLICMYCFPIGLLGWNTFLNLVPMVDYLGK